MYREKSDVLHEVIRMHFIPDFIYHIKGFLSFRDFDVSLTISYIYYYH